MTTENETLGTYLAERRRERQIDLPELAHEAGVDAETIQRWESGADKPSDAQLARLSRALAVPMDEMFLRGGRSVDDGDVTSFSP